MEILTTDVNVLIVIAAAIFVLLVIDVLVDVHERKEMKEDIELLCNEVFEFENEPDMKERMTGNDYQKFASRTINHNLVPYQQEDHALKGMVSEIGELNGIYQKAYQGHIDSDEHKKKEVGDLLWFIAEYCTSKGWNLEDIMQMNIDKLKARFPEGFDTEKSIHRKNEDI